MQSETDIVINYLYEKIRKGELTPGNKLFAEREISNILNVSRLHVREAYKKLEQYNIIRIRPKVGTFLNNLSPSAIEHIIEDVMQIQEYDFASLVHVRVVLEREAGILACAKRTEEDLANIKSALDTLNSKFFTDERVPLDFAFHQSIARASHNSVIASLLLLIVPDVVKSYHSRQVCSTPQQQAIIEHQMLYDCILAKDAEGYCKVLEKHLQGLVDISLSL